MRMYFNGIVLAFVWGIMIHLADELFCARLRFSLQTLSIRRVFISGKRKKDVVWEWVCYIYATAYYPFNTSGWTTRCFWPLFLYHISFPPLFLTPFFPHHLSITFWPFPTLLISLPSSWVIHNSCPQHFLLWSFSSLFLLNVLVFFFSLLLSWPL